MNTRSRTKSPISSRKRGFTDPARSAGACGGLSVQASLRKAERREESPAKQHGAQACACRFRGGLHYRCHSGATRVCVPGDHHCRLCHCSHSRTRGLAWQHRDWRSGSTYRNGRRRPSNLMAGGCCHHRHARRNRRFFGRGRTVSGFCFFMICFFMKRNLRPEAVISHATRAKQRYGA